jgi:hypothetical protein
VGGEAPVTPVLSLDSSYLDLSYKPCDNSLHVNDEIYLLSPCYPVFFLTVVYADIFGENFVGDGKRIKALGIVGPAGPVSFHDVRILQQSNEVIIVAS